VTLRVLIAGAGLGGLTLAHALRTAGLQPLLFERASADVDLSSSYRIHIDANGSRALHACLPAELWWRFEQQSAASPRGIEFVSGRLRHLAFIAETREPVAHSRPISRTGLRQLLLSGLEDAISFERGATRFELTDARFEPDAPAPHTGGGPGGQVRLHLSDGSPGGEVRLHLSDGSSVSGDVLVGADGTASAIRKQLLPSARVVDTHVGGIAGKVYLNADVRRWLGERWLSQMTMVLPVRGMSFFMAPFRRQSQQTELDLPEHLFWVLIGQTAGFGPRLRSAGPDELRQQALERVRGWHPLLSDLVRLAAPESLLGVPLHTAEPVPAWTPGRVTLLGDAIHTMTPLQGLGGNTALVDAALLARRLVEADRGRLSLAEAIGGYEARMREYGFAAVAQSLQISNAVASTNVLGRLVFRGVLGAADRLPPLRDALFQRRGIEVGLEQRAA